MHDEAAPEGPEVTVLRLGHRPGRDERLSTHVCLTARAFGAQRVVFPEVDGGARETVEDVVDRFGGRFGLEEVPSWRKLLREWSGTSLHLTMYGERHHQVLGDLAADNLLVVVGSSKVPREVYDLVDANVAVGNQPHSEVAALAVALHEVRGPEALFADREGADVRVVPTPRGKRIEEPGT
jgi:tRNA (cytidine56-2'-O)-methyltransferase